MKSNGSFVPMETKRIWPYPYKQIVLNKNMDLKRLGNLSVSSAPLMDEGAVRSAATEMKTEWVMCA